MASARFVKAHCPYCKGPLEADEPVACCAPCGARHHDDCRNELGRCATCGSRETLVSRTASTRERLRLENERDRARTWAVALLCALVLGLPATGLFTWMATVDRDIRAKRTPEEEAILRAFERERAAHPAVFTSKREVPDGP